jgi:hypothetical protein
MPYFTPVTCTSAGASRLPALPTPVVFEPLGPQRWEYHTISLDPREDEPLDESALNALGNDGWLLAGMLPADGGMRGRITYYFVRAAA